MAGSGGYGWSRKLAARMRTLRSLVRDTQRALNDVSDILNFDPEIQIKVQDIGNLTTRATALVILGTSASARVRLLHCLLGRRLLPHPMPRGCRWLRIQYGSTTQVHVSLGNSEFEMVEELESNKRTWDTLPIEDLLRQEQTDLATVLEVELNIPFLKNGLTILFPPDVESVVDSMNYSILKQTHSELYTKRDAILRNSNPVYLYALDRTGKNIFSEPYCVGMSSSKSDDDFWTTFDLYRMTSSDNSVSEKVIKSDEVVNSEVSKQRVDAPYVFNAENCLDLHQIKEISPNSQLFFILFSNSVDVSSEEHRRKSEVEDSLQFCGEATESTENPVYDAEDLPESDRDLMQDGVLRHTRDTPEHSKKGKDNRRLFEEQVVFMNELLEQWEFMSNPPPKHYVKSQWIILDDCETLATIDQKGLSFVPNAQSETFSKGCKKETDNEKTVKSRSSFLTKVVKFATEYMHSYMLEYCTKLSEIHVKLLQQFILASFDLARELQVVPKKIQYVAKQEQQLYETINEKFSEGDKKQELVQIMQEVLQEMKTEINNMDWSVDDLPWHQDPRFTVSNSVFYSSCRSSPVSIRPLESVDRSVDESADQSEVEEAESYDGYNFDDYDIIHSNDESLAPSECLTNKVSNVVKDDDALSLSSQIGLIHIENENEMFSLSSSTRRNPDNVSVTTCTNTINMSLKQASLDVQQTVLSKLSRKISLKLVKFVDCLRDTYFGTLQRCVESLEWCCRSELGGRPASEAVRRLLSCARCVQLRPDASFSLLRTLVDSLRRLLYTLHIVGGEAAGACCYLSPVWRRKIANNTIHSLSPQRLARVISAQILERLSVAHERYQSALSSLEVALANRLHHTEDVKLAIRKKYAPSFARLCLESTSICDLLMYGTPDLGPEIGRGQYGVVYSVRGSWAGHSPAAVKSVLPADERHYHELAMEFFYTRTIPAHPRIVRLYGSIVQRHGGGPSVLLVSGRYSRDLHSAVRTGLTFATRMRISCDIVEGIRYLHSLGLVHRDITMKNVLLDANDRAALSDLGFCTAEALMSGSIVGTPVHMAPELFAGEYDAAVDVYAFGILFWFVCAGNIRLPSAFEACQKNKEQLWSRVRKGLRPERLPYFTDECWSVMESCWASEPSQRAHLGDIQPTLERILEQALKREHVGNREKSNTNEHSDIDSMDFNEFADCI